MSKLILTADDFGLNEGVNEATIQSVKNKTITSVQVMINMASEQQIRSLAAAVHEAGNLCGIGLHFCTTYGPSLMQKPTSFTIKDADGVFNFIDIKDWDYHSDSNDDMKEELTAQFKLLKSIIGSERIDSLSSHQNIHLFNPDYMKMVGQLAEDNYVPVRSPLRWNQDLGNKSYPDGLVMQPIEDDAIKTVVNCKSINTRKMLYDGISPNKMMSCAAIINDNKKTGGTPNTMCGHWYRQPKKRALNWIVQQLDEIHPNKPFYATEILMHLSNSVIGDDPKQNYKMVDRLKEFEVLNSIDVKDFIHSLYSKANFELGSYRKVLMGETVSYDLPTVV